MERALQQATIDILASYDTVGGLNNTDGLNLPSKRAVGDICEDLLQILFPGFHDGEAVNKSALPVLTRHRVSSVAERLEDQICKSLQAQNLDSCTGSVQRVLVPLLQDMPKVRDLLSTDIEAAYEGDPAALSSEEIILSYPCIEAIAIQRIAHLLYKSGVPFIPRMMTEWAHSRTGIDIHPGAQIGTHFFIDHGTGVVIGETCRIGNHVKLYHGVTLGARSFARDDAGKIVKGGKRHPDVADNVTIYPNSTVLGGETLVGENSTIGANVFLMHSVPANSLVVYEEKQLTIVPKNKSRNGRTKEVEWSI